MSPRIVRFGICGPSESVISVDVAMFQTIESQSTPRPLGKDYRPSMYQDQPFMSVRRRQRRPVKG